MRMKYRSSKKTKYRNRKVYVDDMVFDSQHEYERWLVLLQMQEEGKIWGLQRQVPFPLLPSQRINGKVVERPVKYVADFTYTTKAEDGTDWFVVEDAKGMRTPEYIIKRKLLLWFHGIRIQEV